MLATPVRERGTMSSAYEPMAVNYGKEVLYSREEFMDEFAKQLGRAYGLSDIREAR